MSNLSNRDELDLILDSAARAVADEERAMTEHPTTEELVGYQENRLTDIATQQVRHHLVGCEKCANEVLVLEQFDLANVEANLLPSASKVGEAWATFQQKLDQRVLADTRLGSVSKTATKKIAWAMPHFLALAASVLLTLGLGYMVFDIGYANPFMVDLVPDGAGSIRDASTEREVLLPKDMDALLLRLNLGNQTPYVGYRAEIRGADGAIHWQQEGLQRQPAGQFIVAIRRARLRDGNYELNLFGIGSGEAETLATYTFRLRHTPKE